MAITWCRYGSNHELTKSGHTSPCCERKRNEQDEKLDIQLHDLLHQKLHSFKSRLILWAQELDDPEIKTWSKTWSNAALIPMPHLEPKTSLAPFFLALAVFVTAAEQLKTQQFKASFETLFGLESLFGHENGLKTADKRMAAEKARKRHRETINDKRLAIEFYIKNDLSNMSNQKAAEVLAKQFPLKVRTLQGYISDYRRYRDVMRTPGSPITKPLLALEEIAAGLAQVISSSPDKHADAAPLLQQAKETIKTIEVRMLGGFLSESIEETKEQLEMSEAFQELSPSELRNFLYKTASEIWSDPSGPLQK